MGKRWMGDHTGRQRVSGRADRHTGGRTDRTHGREPEPTPKESGTAQAPTSQEAHSGPQPVMFNGGTVGDGILQRAV